jgi:hypothetical protein
MDKGAGHKPSAFTWAMGELILARIAEGETVREITAHPAMPAYCTVFRWMQVVPEFGAAVRELRAALAQVRLEERDELRRLTRRRRKDGAAWHGGRRPVVSAAALGRVLDAVRDGASMTEALRTAGTPSAKAFYSRVRRCPAFRLAFADACGHRDFMLEQARWEVMDGVFATGIVAANAGLRAVDGRRGRLRPKLYRTRA